ncbi:MAG: type II toxin-antitoxin system RelE/ParE family toxin [Neisseriaceae bacterium]|nr:type II toxin-antitoxin system RelE/ParE family toxin [Neisseriaceae bacterium]MBQ9183065.1 type II toxin-antitoxin system RelE/ParE family toxin [Neisseriaceae bacterium]
MPQIIITPKAADGLERCRLFLAEKNPLASKHASEVIQKSFQLLKSQPKMGRPCQTKPLRELIIPFASSGYVALYRYEKEVDTVYILAFKHAKEAGY